MESGTFLMVCDFSFCHRWCYCSCPFQEHLHKPSFMCAKSERNLPARSQYTFTHNTKFPIWSEKKSHLGKKIKNFVKVQIKQFKNKKCFITMLSYNEMQPQEKMHPQALMIVWPATEHLSRSQWDQLNARLEETPAWGCRCSPMQHRHPERGKGEEQRRLCLKHWSGFRSLCKFGKKHGESLFLRFESLTNMRWKSPKDFPKQRKSPTAA